MKIIKTQSPSTVVGKVVSHPIGDNPYTLITVTEEQVEKLNLESDVVEDTVPFLAAYNLAKEEEEL